MALWFASSALHYIYPLPNINSSNGHIQLLPFICTQISEQLTYLNTHSLRNHFFLCCPQNHFHQTPLSLYLWNSQMVLSVLALQPFNLGIPWEFFFLYSQYILQKWSLTSSYGLVRSIHLQKRKTHTKESTGFWWNRDLLLPLQQESIRWVGLVFRDSRCQGKYLCFVMSGIMASSVRLYFT